MKGHTGTVPIVGGAGDQATVAAGGANATPSTHAGGAGGATSGTTNGTGGATQARAGTGAQPSAGNAASSGGTAASGAGGNAAASGSGNAGVGQSGAGGRLAAGAGGAASVLTTGTFPAITDPWQPGPFTVATMLGAGPSGDATVLYPQELGMNGLKHPIVVWDDGAGQTGLSIYGSLLQHLASHGFAVYAAFSATDQGTELTTGLDWMIAQAGMNGSMFYQKLDVTKTAAMGHSQGSIATFAIAGDPRLTTTIHLSGGTNPDIAQGHATLANLHNPAAFLCGQVPGPLDDGLTVGDTASPWCEYDFENASVPVFLAQIQGASHITAPGMTLGACAAWLRWQLMGDTTMKVNFVGMNCTLCMRPNWMCMSRGLM